MLEGKGLEHEHNKKRASQIPWKITKWEGQSREQKRHKDMMKVIKRWERKN